MNLLDALFHWFISATMRGALLALAVFCIHAALRSRMPARWRYLLWLPVVLVLAAPVLPQSRWSMENGFAIGDGRAARLSSVTVIDGGMSAGLAPVAHSSGFSWRTIAAIAWLSGAAGLAAFSLGAYAQTMRKLRRGSVEPSSNVPAAIVEAATTIGLRRVPELLVSTVVRSPAVTGFLRPTLLLPATFPGPFSEEEARLVLLHELIHLKRFDLPVNWFLCLLQAVHWCNPVLWFAFARIRADREAACDEAVLDAASTDSRAEYGHALLKLEGESSVPGMSLGILGIFEGGAGLRERIRAVAAYRRSHVAWVFVCLLLVAVLIAIGGTREMRARTSPSHSEPRSRVAGPVPEAGNDATTFSPHTATSAAANRFSPTGRESEWPAAAVSLANSSFLSAGSGVTVSTGVGTIGASPGLKTREWIVDWAALGIPDDQDFMEFLKTKGITSPPGSSASFSTWPRRVTLKNTEENLERFDALVKRPQ